MFLFRLAACGKNPQPSERPENPWPRGSGRTRPGRGGWGRSLCPGLLALTGLIYPKLAAAAELDPVALLAAQRASTLGTEARRVENVDLDAGLAAVRLESGWVFPVLTPDGRPTPEVVFRGRGRFTLVPVDTVEAAQLEVFTDASELDEPFTEAVFVIADEVRRAGLFERPASPIEAGELEAARALHGRWRASRERTIMGIPGALWRLGLGEPLFKEFFAGFLQTENHGKVLYLVDPEDDEQVSLGRFVPLDLDRKEERKARRDLHRDQQQGRFVGLDLADLGSWDTWVRSALAAPGRATFEPRHYGLKAQVGTAGLVSGTVEVELTATGDGARTVAFSLHPGTEISALRDATGQPMPHFREENSLIALLPSAPAAGETTSLSIDFSGTFLERHNSHRAGGDIWYLPNTTRWYPRTGNADRATYEAEVTTATGVVLAPGAPTGSKPGKVGRFLLQQPTLGFTFEVGTFKTFTDTHGEIPITLHLDTTWRDFEIDGETLIAEIRQALEYLQEIFGPLPHETLTAVTAPRFYSQSLPGFLMLSDGMMTPRWITEDPRTVIAHELAHQWWGHRAGFTSYRDQWISEAMANYASVQYARAKLNREYGKRKLSPTDGWKGRLNRITPNGMPIESLGPVVLGRRLNSAISDGYVPIVYVKGALVIDSLHNLLGPETFLSALRKILVDPASRDLTTAEFLAGLERHGGVTLREFADRFIYGVGLPEVYYSYRFEPSGPGKWAVVGTARQQAPYHYRYRLQPVAGGLPDVVRETVERVRIARNSNLAVPVEIGILQPDAPPPSRKLSRAEQKLWLETQAREGNAVLAGRTILRGAEASFRFETPHEPRILWFDRHEEVFCVFYDERRFPKRTALYRGIDHAAAGRQKEAEAAFREVLTAPLTTDPEPEKIAQIDRFYTQLEVDWLDRSAHLHLARLLLDTGRIADAKAALESAQGGDRTRMPLAQKHQERILEARLALREGRPDRVIERLSGSFTQRQVLTREAQTLLAVAAWATGDTKTLAEARKAAEKAGIDLTLLDQPRSAAGESR